MSFFLLLVLTFGPMAARAQTITGSIVGTVKDPSNLAVSNAEVALVHAGTGAERRAATNERGDFVFKELDPCQKCNEKMLVTAIYKEVREKEKTFAL